VFVVLDEMNLARVEYYFADVLSSIESRHALALHSSSVSLEGSTGSEIPARLPLPTNLFVIGTINDDETTNALSDKVPGSSCGHRHVGRRSEPLPCRPSSPSPELAASLDACGPVLADVNARLAPEGLGFGYRLAGEFVRYHAFASGRLGRSSEEVIDDQLVQKMLVKLRGTEAQRSMLKALSVRLAPYPRAGALLARLTADLDELGTFQNAR
jgi:hypothetical protein